MTGGDRAFRFHGRERVTVELAGTFDAARLALPAGIEHDLDAVGRARVVLFAFFVEHLRVRGVPLARWSYAELLWRVAVRRAGAPAWWVVACDLAARGPRWAARRYVRYDVRPHAVTVEESRVASRGDAGALVIALSPGGHAAVTSQNLTEDRALLVSRDAGWVVPWGDDARAPVVPVAARVEDDSLSRTTVGDAVSWEHHGRLRRGRAHRCGVARR